MLVHLPEVAAVQLNPAATVGDESDLVVGTAAGRGEPVLDDRGSGRGGPAEPVGEPDEDVREEEADDGREERDAEEMICYGASPVL